MIIFHYFQKSFFYEDVRLIIGSKVLNYERHVRFFQFWIYWKTIESSLEDLNCTHVTKPTQEQ